MVLSWVQSAGSPHCMPLPGPGADCPLLARRTRSGAQLHFSCSLASVPDASSEKTLQVVSHLGGLRGGPRRHRPGRPGDPRPACAPPAAPAPPPPPPAPQLPAARCAQRPDAEGSERPNRTGSGEGAGEEGGGSFLLPGGAGGFLSSFSPGTRARTYTRGHTRARARWGGRGW